jgi:predicted RNase H-like HicB family nuclease
MEPLAFYLNQPYSFAVIPDPDGGFFIHYPDLPGCMTQVEELKEIGPAADEIRVLWLETAYDQGVVIPLPREDPIASRSTT